MVLGKKMPPHVHLRRIASASPACDRFGDTKCENRAEAGEPSPRAHACVIARAREAHPVLPGVTIILGALRSFSAAIDATRLKDASINRPSPYWKS